ncbi:unnamed protein product [Chironomus riparius]|uniref:Uncharacterized protein n=1 Tax=Chironomus riparius TaxID=315576 RepID=A0A9N9WZ46_9DIPT|nr:unnamed protein product [Chironomus riparius]
MILAVPEETNFARFRQDDNQNLTYIRGPAIDIMSSVSESLNFKLVFTKCISRDCMNYQMEQKYQIYNVLLTYALDAKGLSDASGMGWLGVMLNIDCTPQLYVPPGDLYTSFEKILLPFDKETWIGLAITFTSAVPTVFMTSRLSSSMKHFICGSGIKTPILNIFRAFFGIGQTQLPDRICARIIFMSFVLWCLVIRTAYQGKLFEFITTAVRKPQLKSLAELRKRNFTLYVGANELENSMIDTMKQIFE